MKIAPLRTVILGVLSLALCLGATELRADAPEPILDVEIDHPIILFGGKAAMQAAMQPTAVQPVSPPAEAQPEENASQPSSFYQNVVKWFKEHFDLGDAPAPAPAPTPAPKTAAAPTRSPIATPQAVPAAASDPSGNQATLRVTALNFPQDAKLTYQWRQIQDLMNPLAADMTKKVVTIDHPDAAKIVAKFPAWGVYEFRVTVTDTEHQISVSRNAWVNVWDSKSHILHDGKPDPLAVAPAIMPPNVRHLSPDPGPFQHPRLLCSNQDWNDINDRCVKGKGIIAGDSYTKLEAAMKGYFAPTTPEGKVYSALLAYAQSGYKDPAPDILLGEKDPGKAAKFLESFLFRMKMSALYYWIKNDPTLPHTSVDPADAAKLRELCAVFGAFCQVQLANCWDFPTAANPDGVFHPTYPGFFTQMNVVAMDIKPQDLAECLAYGYDFLQSWMTDDEQLKARNLLFAVGPGRMTSRGYAHDGKDHWVGRGPEQQGTFSNFTDYQITAALVVAGEDSGADPRVLNTFVPKQMSNVIPDGMPGWMKDPKYVTTRYDSVRYCTEESGFGGALSHPYPEETTWPHARKVDVDNIRRALWYITDGGVTPWGWVGEREAYITFYTVAAWPRAIMFARFGGENQFVTSYYYNMINMILYSSYPYGPKHESAHFSSEVNPITHHAGNGDHRGMHTLLLKYMYPDDPAVDYMFASRASGRESKMNGPSLEACLFAIDPDIKNTKGQMEAVAEKKALPLTKLDPEEGIVVCRNDWKDDTLLVDFDCGFQGGGHMDAEKNSFSLFALGRDWAISPGFHKVYSNWHSGIQFQEPAWAACPYTQGYVGLHPCYKPAVDSCDMPLNFPPPLRGNFWRSRKAPITSMRLWLETRQTLTTTSVAGPMTRR